MNPRYEYRALLACDIAGSAGRGERRLQEIRSALRSALSIAVGVAGLDERDFVYVDTGDGCQLVAPAGLPKARLLVPLLPELNSRVREHNRHAAPEVRLRVRVAAHAGEIRIEPDGRVSGAPFEALARLLDSAPLRQAASTGTSGTPVAAILSHHVHEDTVGHGHEGLEADAFSPATIEVKEYAAKAWLWYPGSPVGPRVEPADLAHAGEGEGEGEGAGAGLGEGAGLGTGAGPGAESGTGTEASGKRTVEQQVNAKGRSRVFAVSRGIQYVDDTDNGG